jgi:hypothetical protein
MQTVKHKILTRVNRFVPGRAFIAKDFLDIAALLSGVAAYRHLKEENAKFPKLFSQPDVLVTSLLAKRTFWG